MTKKELKKILIEDKKKYFNGTRNKLYFLDKILQESNMVIWKYVKSYRLAKYYFEKKDNFIDCLKYFYYEHKKQKYGVLLGITIDFADIGEGLQIYHYGSIVINGNAKIGKNLELHGNNCIGNKGSKDKSAPIIGDNVDIGFGASVLGQVKVASGVKIGAGAVVVHDILQENCTVVGVPAKIIK